MWALQRILFIFLAPNQFSPTFHTAHDAVSFNFNLWIGVRPVFNYLYSQVLRMSYKVVYETATMQLLCWAVTFRCMLTSGALFCKSHHDSIYAMQQKTLPGNCNLLFSHNFLLKQAFTCMMNMKIWHTPLEGGPGS